jgi:hypothetical protein
VSKKVVFGDGWTVLMLLKARPTRPSLFVSDTNCDETEVAASTACDVAVTAPRELLLAKVERTVL